MIFEKILILSACLYFALAFAEKELELRSKCRLKTIVCPCTDENGVQLNVTVKTCLVDHLTGKKSACNGEAILTKCKRAYLSSERHRRNAVSQTPNCNNGTILPSQSSSALTGLPKVTINGHKKYILSGKPDVKFRCTVNISKLSATVRWLLNGSALVGEKNRHEYLDCNTVLLIKGVMRRDAGNYTCVVENAVGQATASSYLSFERKLQGPYIEYVKLEDNSGNTAYTGSTVNLTCKAHDYTVQNKFLKDNSPIQEGDHYEYFHIKYRDINVKILNLEIKNVTIKDAGNYSCIALRDGLHTCKSFHLKVVNLTATCPRGYYCPPGSVHPTQCPWGTYQPQVGQSSLGACKKCPDFILNLSKPDPFYKPVANITDCVKGNMPTESEDEQPLPSNHITAVEMIGITAGVLGIVIIIVLLFYCLVKRSSRNRTTYQYDPETLPCEPVFPNGDCQRQSLCENIEDAENIQGAENIQDAEVDQVVKKAPEIDYEPRYDVFICYSYKDVDWVKELVAELEKRGFTCCIDFKDFVPGAPIVENISQAICYSRKTIAVLTPDSVQSDWWSHELQKALTRIRFHQVVPVVYKSCEIPLILQDRTYLDWENCNVKPYFWDQLEKALRQPNDGVI